MLRDVENTSSASIEQDHSKYNVESETEDASLSCSSDIESEVQIRKYGAFPQVVSNLSQLNNANTGLSFSFAQSSLQPLATVPSSFSMSTSEPSAAMVASAIARESS